MKIVAVAIREYLATVRTRAFLLAIILLPALGAVAVILPLLAESQSSAKTRVFALVDETGVAAPALRRALDEDSTANTSTPGIWDGATRPGRFDMHVVRPQLPRNKWLLELSQQVKSGHRFAFIVVDEGLVEGREQAKLRYHSATPTATELKQWAKTHVEQAIQAERLRRAGIDPSAVAQTRGPVPLVEEPLYVSQNGVVEREQAPHPLRDLGFPLLATMIMFTATMMGIGPLIQSTLEEKMYRIAEVLVSSVPPFQMMLGKLLGAAGVSFTLMFTYLVGSLLLAAGFGYSGDLPWHLMVVLPPFLGLSVLIYGAIFLAVGAACSDLKETQSLTMPLMLVITAPWLLVRFVLADPNGTASVVASLVPLFAPVLMLLRLLLSPPPPLWQLALGCGLALVTGLFCLSAAGRIFRVGMLMKGSRPGLRQLWAWIRAQ